VETPPHEEKSEPKRIFVKLEGLEKKDKNSGILKPGDSVKFE
jgi:hypothetical protein